MVTVPKHVTDCATTRISSNFFENSLWIRSDSWVSDTCILSLLSLLSFPVHGHSLSSLASRFQIATLAAGTQLEPSRAEPTQRKRRGKKGGGREREGPVKKE
ncbi:hypothetical protein ACOSQ3_024995 [Xanthoceras sorbifolium]